MRLAYADPPYPGQAVRHYGNHPDFGGEVDHGALLLELESYDGWALSTSASALQGVLALCPAGVRVAAWQIPNSEPPGNRGTWHWSWEPVIVAPARPPQESVRDVLRFPKPVGGSITGQKSVTFCHWVFRLMGAERQGDTLDDLFPGSGAVSASWMQWTQQTVLSPC